MLEFKSISMGLGNLKLDPLVVSTVLPLANMMNSASAFLSRGSIGIQPTNHAQAIADCCVSLVGSHNERIGMCLNSLLIR
jgi:hypothetical protein